jgi:hypothetical protein
MSWSELKNRILWIIITIEYNVFLFGTGIEIFKLLEHLCFNNPLVFKGLG